MAKVRMAVAISGTRDGADWPGVGDVLDVDAAEAEHLVSAGLAAAVVDVEAAAESKSAETATAPKPRRRKA